MAVLFALLTATGRLSLSVSAEEGANPTPMAIYDTGNPASEAGEDRSYPSGTGDSVPALLLCTVIVVGAGIWIAVGSRSGRKAS
ncbi:MAG: hypothetical protein ACI3XR_04200 [Eubacteriales bacterium]